MRYGSVCSGIEAASVAWHGPPLNWKPAWFSEIEDFPSRVLAHHHPEVANLGDMTTIAPRVLAGEVEAPPLLVGGTPCQAFSLAGLRGSLSDARGNLALSFVELADAIDAVRSGRGERPCWVLWENVPGVFTVEDNAFGCFLGGLVGADAPLQPAAGTGWSNAGVAAGPRRTAAWRVLDAQHFGVAQRRRRVFVLARGGAGDWSAPEALLPLLPRLQRHPAPRRAPGPGAAGAAAVGAAVDLGIANPLGSCTRGGGLRSTDPWSAGAFIPEVAPAVTAKWAKGTGGPAGDECQNLVPIPFDTTQITHRENRSRPEPGDPAPTLAKGGHAPAIAFSIVPEGGQGADLRASPVDLAPALTTEEAKTQDRGVRVVATWGVRRLTERECERLQAFPDDFTKIPGATAGARYAALGNTMATVVMRHIGRAIQRVEDGHATGGSVR